MMDRLNERDAREWKAPVWTVCRQPLSRLR